MKHRLMLLSALLVAGLVLCSCRGQTAPVGEEQTTPAELTDRTSAQTDADPASDAELTCTLSDGTSVLLGSDGTAAEAALGTPVSVLEAPSCVHEGSDRTCQYNGFSVTVCPDGRGGTYVAEVVLTSDAVTFANGITVGSTADAVTAAFGDDYTESFGIRRYTRAGGSLCISLTLEDGVVRSCGYYYVG